MWASCAGDSITFAANSSAELERRVGVCGLVKGYLAHHIAAAHKRGQPVLPFALGVEHADSCGCVYFVSRKYVEVTIQGLHIHPAVGYALGAVYQHRNPSPVRGGDHLLYGILHTQDVGNMVYGNHPDAALQSRTKGRHINRAVVCPIAPCRNRHHFKM